MDIKTELKKLIDELIQSRRELNQLLFDEDGTPDLLGEPCSPRQLAELQRVLAKPLPPSYRAFLEIHNGWDKFSGANKILSVEDQSESWVVVQVEKFHALFEEFGGKDPFRAGAIPVVMGENERTYLVLDPRKVRPNGEMDLIWFDYTQEDRRYSDFVSFLRSELRLVREMIEDEKKGSTTGQATQDEQDED